MSDELNHEIESLKAAKVSLEGYIDRLSAEKQALKQAVNEIVEINLNYKAATILMDRQAEKLSNEIQAKNKEIEELKNKLQQVANEELAAQAS